MVSIKMRVLLRVRRMKVTTMMGLATQITGIPGRTTRAVYFSFFVVKGFLSFISSLVGTIVVSFFLLLFFFSLNLDSHGSGWAAVSHLQGVAALLAAAVALVLVAGLGPSSMPSGKREDSGTEAGRASPGFHCDGMSHTKQIRPPQLSKSNWLSPGSWQNLWENQLIAINTVEVLKRMGVENLLAG